jgi:hypothetical protein
MEKDRKALLDKIAPKKTVCEDRISAGLKFAIVEIVIRKI